MIRLARALAYPGGLLFALLALVFLIFSALPSDPARLILGPNAAELAVIALRSELGLDRPIVEQFGSYLIGLVRGDLGRSFVTRRPVAPDVLDAAAMTLTYAGLALFCAAIYSAITSAVAHFMSAKWRLMIALINGGVTSVPQLIVALAVGMSFLVLDLLAFLAPGTARNAVFACVALSAYPAATLSQILIGESDSIRTKPYVLAARSTGLAEIAVFWRVVWRHAMLPWMAQLSNVAATLVAGSVVVEVVFSLPGLGRLVLQSVLRQDFPMIQGVVLVSSVTFLLLNGLTELFQRRLFPAHNAA